MTKILNLRGKPWHCPKCKRHIASIKVDEYLIEIEGKEKFVVLRCPKCLESLYSQAGDPDFDKIRPDLESRNLSKTVPLMSR